MRYADRPDARRRTEQSESHSDNREVRDNRGPREPRNDNRDNRNNSPRNYNDQDGGNRNRNRNRRRRSPGGFRNNRDDGPQGADRYESNEMQDSNEPINNDPIEVSGYLDLRDEGYGFLRVNCYLASQGGRLCFGSFNATIQFT
ncbi:hypothetical protein EMGBS4_05660 [Acidimicrobiaceae bacterium]|nr:hypothetical protein EMGBS4_05660 [Acidimicrobiaceae bacterium]